MTDRELDQLIDDALPSYAGEPDAGMADSVLARVRQPRRFPWMPLAAMAAAAILLAVVQPAIGPWLNPEIEPPPLVSFAPAPPPAVAQPVVRPRISRPSAVRPGSSLSRQERQLLALVSANPELAVRVLVDEPRQMAEPLRIAPIVIEPLTPSGGE